MAERPFGKSPQVQNFAAGSPGSDVREESPLGSVDCQWDQTRAQKVGPDIIHHGVDDVGKGEAVCSANIRSISAGSDFLGSRLARLRLSFWKDRPLGLRLWFVKEWNPGYEHLREWFQTLPLDF